MKKLLFPNAYYMGKGILSELGEIVKPYGTSFVFIGSKSGLKAVQDIASENMRAAGYDCTFIESKKLCCNSEKKRLMEMDVVKEAETLCAVGGGGCMDLVRFIAFNLKKNLIMIPTAAASDAPCTQISLTYAEDGSQIIEEFIHYRCPDAVIVDTQIIADAPERLIAAGMGDAMATYYECMTCYNNPKLGANITETAVILAQGASGIVKRYGVEAYEAVKTGEVTKALENVIEANCFLSSMGGVNSGCACAHGFGDWLASVHNGHDYLHGERVMVGLVVQMILEGYPEEEIKDMVAFGKRVNLPVCVVDVTDEDYKDVAKRAAKELQNDHFMLNLNCDFSEAVLEKAILYACELSK